MNSWLRTVGLYDYMSVLRLDIYSRRLPRAPSAGANMEGSYD